MKNNKLNRNVNKVITLTMAGAVALSAPLSFVYASPDADEQHEYTDIHGVCDICGETKEDGNHFVDEIIDDGIIEIDPNDTENDKKDDDVIISASPEFLLKPICKKINIKYLIASNVDKNSRKIYRT